MSDRCALIDNGLATVEAEILVGLNYASTDKHDPLLRAAASVAEARREIALLDGALSPMGLLTGHVITPESSEVLLRNFANIIGSGSHCPRCLLRGDAARWSSERSEEWQVFECRVCGYKVMDR